MIRYITRFIILSIVYILHLEYCISQGVQARKGTEYKLEILFGVCAFWNENNQRCFDGEFYGCMFFDVQVVNVGSSSWPTLVQEKKYKC